MEHMGNNSWDSIHGTAHKCVAAEHLQTVRRAAGLPLLNRPPPRPLPPPPPGKHTLFCTCAPLTHVRAQPLELQRAYVSPVQQHAALKWVIEALNETNNGRLAAAAAANQRHRRACRQHQQPDGK